MSEQTSSEWAGETASRVVAGCFPRITIKACRAVALAIDQARAQGREEAAKVVEAQPFHSDYPVSGTIASFLAAKIRALGGAS